MNLRALLCRNLLFHWRANLAVLLGVMIGTAVLAGALLVGDSLRGSLRDLTLNRLGRIDDALVTDRFFPADLAQRISKAGTAVEHAAAIILLRGTVLRYETGGRLGGRAGQVQIIGVDEAFWPLFDAAPRDLTEAVLPNEALIRELDAHPGDLLEVRFDRPQAVPADSILGKRAEVDEPALPAKPFAEILPNSGLGRFSLAARQQQPLILYVKLQQLQRELQENLQLDQPANALLVAARSEAQDAGGAELLQQQLQAVAQPEDAGFKLRKDATGERYLSLESRRMLLEQNVVEVFRRSAVYIDFRCVPTLTYLANRITHSDRFAPYSTITGLDPSAGPPWGPFLLVDGQPAPALKDDEILINDWLAADLWPDGKWQDDREKPVITITYFVESDTPKLQEKSATFKLAGVVALKGPAADPTLTPDFPGIRGRRIADWKPPFPKDQWHPEWVRPKDEDYWRRFKATPKAFVSPKTAATLWHSRFGQYTSLRLAPRSMPWPFKPGALDALEKDIRRDFFEKDWQPPDSLGLRFDSLGLRFQPVKAQGLSAGMTAESFGWLFLGFSIFLIASAAMLVGLLFQLGIERRAKEIGLLFASGFSRRTVRRLLLGEGLLLAVAGSLLGLGLAVGYAVVLLKALNHFWANSLQISFLKLHVAMREPLFGPMPYPSLTIGFILGIGISALSISLALRGLGKVSPHGLLAGQWTSNRITGASAGRRLLWTAGIAIAVAAALAGVSFAMPADTAPLLFFGSGAALLAGGLALTALWLRRRGRAVHGEGWKALIRLGAHNAARFPGRSLTTAGLLASAAFLIIAVEAFRQTARPAAGDLSSGTGGFTLVAEADVPLLHIPDSPMGLRRQRRTPSLTGPHLERALAGLSFYGFRVRPGDDVSCLNLYQPRQPRVLGVPQAMIERGGFRFAGLWQPTAPERSNPWLLLNRPTADDKEVPVLADANTAEWVLHKALGDTWSITDDDGRAVSVRLVGLLQGSLFQSEFLMSEGNFRRLFPTRRGYGFLLIEIPSDRARIAKQALENDFGVQNGLVVSLAADRLAAYQAVENTYLSTFQVLGGLGLLLGTAGLAVVLLRNVWERQGELALLRALGYSRAALGGLVLAENGFLMLCGLGVGVISALLAVLPHVLERAGSLPWLGIAALILLETVVGLLAGGLAGMAILRTPLLPALRRE